MTNQKKNNKRKQQKTKTNTNETQQTQTHTDNIAFAHAPKVNAGRATKSFFFMTKLRLLIIATVPLLIEIAYLAPTNLANDFSNLITF